VSHRELRIAQEILGHTEIRTAEIYAHLTGSHPAAAAEINLGPVDLGD
jgi:site-specific recombinase XerC